MAESSFRETLGFLDQIGVFDVVLPFLLVFTIMFAMLEKTRIFGVDRVDGHEYTKKNLNSLAAFVIAFFVIGSSQLVAFITEISANVVILLLASIMFLILAGSFHKESTEGYFLTGAYQKIFMVVMFLGLLLIFLNALEFSDGTTYLEAILGWLSNFMTDVGVSSIVLLLIVVGFIWFVTRGGGGTGGNHGNGNSNNSGGGH